MNLDNIYEQLKTTIQPLGDKIHSLTNTVKSLEERIHELEQENTELKEYKSVSIVRTLSTQIKDIKQERDILQRQVQHYKTKWREEKEKDSPKVELEPTHQSMEYDANDENATENKNEKEDSDEKTSWIPMDIKDTTYWVQYPTMDVWSSEKDTLLGTMVNMEEDTEQLLWCEPIYQRYVYQMNTNDMTINFMYRIRTKKTSKRQKREKKEKGEKHKSKHRSHRLDE